MQGTHETWLRFFHAIIAPLGAPGGLSLLDLCCGEMAVTRHLHFGESLHLDVIDAPGRPREFPFRQIDVGAWILNDRRQWDVIVLSDGLEHFRKREGMDILDYMREHAQIPVVFVPVGDDTSVDEDADGPHTHKSLWTPEEFEDWNTLVWPDWHPTIGLGAMFAWLDPE